jgi:hypothetical protein
MHCKYHGDIMYQLPFLLIHNDVYNPNIEMIIFKVMAMGRDRSVFSLNIFSYHVNKEAVCTNHVKYINSRLKGNI